MPLTKAPLLGALHPQRRPTVSQNTRQGPRLRYGDEMLKSKERGKRHQIMLIPRQLSDASGSVKACWLCYHFLPLVFLLTVLSTACYNTSVVYVASGTREDLSKESRLKEIPWS